MPHCVWELSGDGDGDLVLVAAPPGEAATASDGAAPGTTPCVWILDREQSPTSPAPALYRPLQIEAFAAVLRAHESQLGLNPTDGTTDAGANGTSIAATVRPSPTVERGAEARSPAASPALQSDLATRANRAGDIAVSTFSNPRIAYRLTHWPSADLLRGRPQFTRMLGFLARGPMSVSRLMVLSGMDEATCAEMLGLLEERKLLLRSVLRSDEALPPGQSRARRAHDDPELTSAINGFADSRTERKSAADADPRKNIGLLQRFRQRLGL